MRLRRPPPRRGRAAHRRRHAGRAGRDAGAGPMLLRALPGRRPIPGCPGAGSRPATAGVWATTGPSRCSDAWPRSSSPGPRRYGRGRSRTSSARSRRWTEVAVWKRPDPEWGERVVAWVVVRGGAEPPALDEVRELVATRVAPYAAPKELVVVDALPATPGGKVRRTELDLSVGRLWGLQDSEPLAMHREPPSTTSVSPVIQDAASEHRNSAALAMSSASPRRRVGRRLAIFSSPGLPQRLGQLGLHQSGGDGVDPDGRPELTRQLAGEVDHGGLGHVVPTDPALDGDPADGGDVEDDAAVIGHPRPPGRLGPLQVAGLVDPDRLVGPPPVDLDDRSVVRIGGGVVDQDVDPAEPVDGRRHTGLGLLGVAGVGHGPGHLARARSGPPTGSRRPTTRAPRRCATRASPRPRRRRRPGRWPGRSRGSHRSPAPSCRRVAVPWAGQRTGDPIRPRERRGGTSGRSVPQGSEVDGRRPRRRMPTNAHTSGPDSTAWAPSTCCTYRMAASVWVGVAASIPPSGTNTKATVRHARERSARRRMQSMKG